MHSGTDFTEELILVEAGAFVKRAEEINRKITARQKADAFLVPLAFVVAIALVSITFVTVTVPKGNDYAKATQEQTHVANR
jgi:hypothetical protein